MITIINIMLVLLILGVVMAIFLWAFRQLDFPPIVQKLVHVVMAVLVIILLLSLLAVPGSQWPMLIKG